MAVFCWNTAILKLLPLLLHTILLSVLAWSRSLFPNRSRPVQRLELLAQRSLSRPRDAIGAAALLGFQRLNPAPSLQSRQRGIERTGFEPGSAELGNIFHHSVAMLWAIRQAGQDQQRRIRKAPQVKLFFVHQRSSSWLCSFTLHSIIYYVKKNTMDKDRCQAFVSVWCAVGRTAFSTDMQCETCK